MPELPEQVPKDHAVDSRIRRKGSRYALYAAIVMSAFLAVALAAYFIEGRSP